VPKSERRRLRPRRLDPADVAPGGSAVSEMFGQLPAVLSFDGTEQSFQVVGGLLTNLRPCEPVSDALGQVVQMLLPLGKRNELLSQVGSV